MKDIFPIIGGIDPTGFRIPCIGPAEKDFPWTPVPRVDGDDPII